jgi:hypothetical protein
MPKSTVTAFATSRALAPIDTILGRGSSVSVKDIILSGPYPECQKGYEYEGYAGISTCYKASY